jgi:hypothetical protein
MDDDVAAHLEALESHVARLEAIVPGVWPN